MRKLFYSLGVVAGLMFPGANGALAAESPELALNAMTLGVAGDTDLALGILEARATVSSHLQLTAAPTIVAIEGASTEHQFRTAATLLLDLGTIRLDDRNLWVFSDAGTTRYRNRLRLTRPTKLGGQVIRLQLLDEQFYEKGGRGWFRNLLGAGFGVDAGRAVSIDAYWMLQDDEGKQPSSLLIVMLTVHLL
jgi:hypothetical protein